MHAQESLTNDMVTWMKTGNAKEMSNYFISNIDLTVDDADDVYSRAQAEMIISKFFTDNPPSGFEIRHEGKSKMEDLYRIGKLSTKNGTYRVTFFMKKEGDKFMIKQLRIEESDF